MIAVLTFLSALLLFLPSDARAESSPASHHADAGSATADVSDNNEKLPTLRSRIDPVGTQCEDFAGRQIRLADRQIRRDNYNAALKVLNTAAKNCDIPEVRDKIESVLTTWWNTIHRTGSPDRLSSFMSTVQSQPYLPNGAEGRFAARLTQSLSDRIENAFAEDDYASAHRLCRPFASYTDTSFLQYYRCGESARQVGANATAASRYEWLLSNWDSEPSDVSWSDAASRLSDLYMKTARFDDAFGLTKRVAARDTEPGTLLRAVTAVRASMLEPIARVGHVLFQGMTPDRAVSYAKTGMSRVRFPQFVESVYTVTPDLGADIAFYGADDARLPSAAAVSSANGTISLLQSENARRAWIITPINAGYLFVQFSQKTVAEENVILESLLSDIQNESEWNALYDYEFTATYPATGSAVATLLGAAYLSQGSVNAYQSVFNQAPVLDYFGVQNEDGDIVAAHAYARDQMDYTDGEWSKTSQTPALYHHEVTKNDTPLREVVWPMYDDQQWSGVVRVGIISRN